MKKFLSPKEYNAIYSESTGILISERVLECAKPKRGVKLIEVLRYCPVNDELFVIQRPASLPFVLTSGERIDSWEVEIEVDDE